MSDAIALDRMKTATDCRDALPPIPAKHPGTVQHTARIQGADVVLFGRGWQESS
jgi:hypothetical protein